MLAPHRDQNLPVRKDSIRMTSQIHDQLELLRCQPDLIGANQHAAAIEVDDQTGSIEASGARRMEGPAYGHVTASKKLVRAERLSDVVVRPLFERGDLVTVLPTSRQNNDR